MVRFAGTLPDGKSTDNEDTYVYEWRKMRDQLCEALGQGHTCEAYDPSFHIRCPNGQHMEIPMALARKMINLHQLAQGR